METSAQRFLAKDSLEPGPALVLLQKRRQTYTHVTGIVFQQTPKGKTFPATTAITLQKWRPSPRPGCGFAHPQIALEAWRASILIVMLGNKMFPSPSEQVSWKSHPWHPLQVISASSPPSAGITALWWTGWTALHFTLLPTTAQELAVSSALLLLSSWLCPKWCQEKYLLPYWPLREIIPAYADLRLHTMRRWDTEKSEIWDTDLENPVSHR